MTELALVLPLERVKGGEKEEEGRDARQSFSATRFWRENCHWPSVLTAVYLLAEFLETETRRTKKDTAETTFEELPKI